MAKNNKLVNQYKEMYKQSIAARLKRLIAERKDV